MIPIILASQSPRRKQLLEWASIPFTVVVQETDESYPDDLAIADVPVFIATNKALAVAQNHLHKIIIAADTIVVLDDNVIGKPQNRQHAIEILQSLAGSKHQVITGVTILYKDKKIAFADTTEVVFHPLSLEQIIYYVDNYKPYDKAGAYGIQDWIGVTGIKEIVGDFYNVMGLPVSRVVQALDKINEL